MKNVTLHPASKKMNVRKPDGSHLNEKGEEITLNAFWYRRLRDGSVTCNNSPAPTQGVAKQKEPKEGAQ